MKRFILIAGLLIIASNSWADYIGLICINNEYKDKYTIEDVNPCTGDWSSTGSRYLRIDPEDSRSARFSCSTGKWNEYDENIGGSTVVTLRYITMKWGEMTAGPFKGDYIETSRLNRETLSMVVRQYAPPPLFVNHFPLDTYQCERIEYSKLEKRIDKQIAEQKAKQSL